jgi:hypothetical protein
MQQAEVLELDPDPRSPTATLALKDGARVTASLYHAAVSPGVGERVWVIRDDPGRPHARIVLPAAEILPELQAQGLVRDVDRERFEALVRESFHEDDPPPGLDGPDILGVLYGHYGREDDEQELIAEDALERAVRDRILVFQDSHETPDLVEDAVAALAEALDLDVLLEEEADFNDVFDALGEAVRDRPENVYLLPVGVNDTAILIRDELAPSRLTLFTEAERAD